MLHDSAMDDLGASTNNKPLDNGADLALMQRVSKEFLPGLENSALAKSAMGVLYDR